MKYLIMLVMLFAFVGCRDNSPEANTKRAAAEGNQICYGNIW
jgi:hypothetical protein